MLALLPLHASLLLLASYNSRIRIRILGSVPLTYRFGSGSGSCLFRQWLASRQRKILFFLSFSAYYFLKVHLHQSLTTKKANKTKIIVEIKVFLPYFDGWWRIRIRIREAQNIRILLHSILVRTKECLKVWKAQFWKAKFFCVSWNSLSMINTILYFTTLQQQHNLICICSHLHKQVASFFIYIKPTIIRPNLDQLLLFTRLLFL